MNNPQNLNSDQLFGRRIIDIAIKLAAMAIIISWCFAIVKPFILVTIWAAILAVALYPAHTKLSSLFKGNKKLASIIIALLGTALIALPAISLSSSIISSAQYVHTGIEQGTLKIPSADESIKDWPLVGEKAYAFWQAASEDIQTVGEKYSEDIKSVASKLLSGAAGLGSTVFQFIISLIIASVFMVKATSLHQGVSKFMHRLMNDNGVRTINTTVASIRSVAVGVLGVAVIQSVASGIGLIIAGIPAAGILAVVVLILAIAQLPPILILGPIAAYYFTIADTTPAIIFLIFSIAVSASDAFLKPMFLGRGMSIPMIVILLGAIGGMLMSGIIGLFVGAVVLAIGYELMIDWLDQIPEGGV